VDGFPLKMNHKLIICLAFCILLPTACSELSTLDSFSDDVSIKGDVVYVLEKDLYSAGDIIKTDIAVSNMEDFPLADCYLVIHLVAGEAMIPNIDENVLYEEVTPSFTLAPKSSKVVPFQYVLPADLKSGVYRLEIYLAGARSYAVGLPFIFMGPSA
jgi:hypothetical protein